MALPRRRGRGKAAAFRGHGLLLAWKAAAREMLERAPGERTPLSRLTIGELLERAQRRLGRVTVATVGDAVRDGALLVDIRSEAQRARHGLIPGAIFHPRNVLEWRCDPSSGYDDPRLSGDLGRRIVLVCHEGYQSSLAAVTLQELGFTLATDLAGGFLAWAAAGLPVVSEVAGDRPVLSDPVMTHPDGLMTGRSQVARFG